MRTRSLALILAVSGGFAQEFRLEKLPAPGLSPTGRVDGAIAYDDRDRRVYLFGGRDTTTRNDLWSYSIEERTWTQLRPSGTAPAARFGHSLLFDPQRRRLILFGGQASGFFNDTWAYEVETNRWIMLAGSRNAPNERYGHSAIYDSTRARMVISHGFTDEGRFDDTWAFDLSSNTWRDISPSAGGVRPLRRCLHHAVADSGGNQMLLYGGCASGFGPCPLGDLWSFDLTTSRWTEITGGTKPAPRQWYGMGFDASRERLVLYGGSGDRGALNDIWEFDPRSRSWTSVTVAGDMPLARQRHEAAYAPGLNGVLFFGGSTNSGLSNDLLLFTARAGGAGPRFTAAGVVNAFSNQAGPLAPGSIATIYGAGLGPEQGVAASFEENGELRRTVAGVTVAFNGIPAPILYVQAGQANVQVPYELAGLDEASLEVKAGDLVSPSVRVSVAATSPGLYSAVFRPDGTTVSAMSPARPGELLVIFATGLGVTAPAARTGFATNTPDLRPAAPLQVRVGGREGAIEFAGLAPGTAGVVQMHVRVPEGAGTGPVGLELRAGDAETRIAVLLE
jgi:uncharacterized protein (TIGR03437 family)